MNSGYEKMAPIYSCGTASVFHRTSLLSLVTEIRKAQGAQRERKFNLSPLDPTGIRQTCEATFFVAQRDCLMTGASGAWRLDSIFYENL